MTQAHTAYELSESQVETPQAIVTLFWRLARRHRSRLGSVLDLGAGDGRFARGGMFEQYIGVEIDKNRAAGAEPLPNGKVLLGCAFHHHGAGYDACIGNPPYARHHDIESVWKEWAVAKLNRGLKISLYRNSNLYLYFLGLALLKSHSDGLVALVIPYEWVSRPSARPLRDYIGLQRWDVTVYRFQVPVFEGVMTTASITIVDKAHRRGRWTYFDVTPDYKLLRKTSPVASTSGVLPYTRRGEIWALRGLSPGSQKVFTLSEGERVRLGLARGDVVPCVTTLRTLPPGLQVLSSRSFQRHFVDSGRKCWLIRSDSVKLSHRLEAYLRAVPEEERQTRTCLRQEPWYRFRSHPVPQLLFGSGFTRFGPKVVLNSVGARAVGSVWGVHSAARLPVRRLQEYLLKINFERRVVPHAMTLKKVEIRQLNGVLDAFARRESRNGRKRSR